MKEKRDTQKAQKSPKNTHQRLCSLPEVHERDLSHIADGHRLRLIALHQKTWVNGTELTYYFFRSPAKWRGGAEQEQAVVDAFQTWKDLGIGLAFKQVDDPQDATIRIGFDQADGSWSYVGRDCIDHADDPAERTTNFGWDLTTKYGKDTALHELGHVLGFPHEHQNPKAGIVWNEEAVYDDLGGPPNNWDRQTTYWNIIRKLPPSDVDGSHWDPDSIMHYKFNAGLIEVPEQYQTEPLVPQYGLSPVDIETAKGLYPKIEKEPPELRPFESQRFDIAAGQQVDFTIRPTYSREYTLQTFGAMDTVMVLFEEIGDRTDFIAGDDDSGFDYNARITARLHRDRKYIVRTRLYYAQAQGNGAIMIY